MNTLYIESFALYYLTMKILIFRVSISIFVLYIYICEALLLKKIDIDTLKMAKDDPIPQDCYVNSMINQVVYLIFLTCQTFRQLAGLKVVLIIDMLNNIHTLEMHIYHCTRNR